MAKRKKNFRAYKSKVAQTRSDRERKLGVPGNDAAAKWLRERDEK